MRGHYAKLARRWWPFDRNAPKKERKISTDGPTASREGERERMRDTHMCVCIEGNNVCCVCELWRASNQSHSSSSASRRLWMRPVQTTARPVRTGESYRKREKGNYSCPCLLLLHSFLPCLVAYAQKASGGNKEKGAAGTGAGEAVAHIELAAVTLMSKVIRRGFFHLLFSIISISHSSLISSKCVSLLLLLLLIPIFFINTFPNCSHPAFFFSRSVLRLINIRALLDHSTRNRWNILKNFWQRIPPPPVIPVAWSFQGPTTTTTRLARVLDCSFLQS